MLCSRLNKIPHIQSLILRPSQIRSFGVSKSKCSWKNSMFRALKSDPMSSFKLRLILRDFTVNRLWNACFKTQLPSSVVKRCRRERMRGVWTSFRQTLFRPSRTLLLSVAAYNGRDEDEDEDEDDDCPTPCSQDISDEDLEALVHDFEAVDELSRTTLFCAGCQRRLVIDKKRPGVVYCQCNHTHPPGPSEDGWVPYMEADDVIIWRKEYKPGGLFAYRVYGRYKDLAASDFAMIQVDGAYRRSWDDAVASLSVVEREANGVRSQTVLHWEVLWPRLFANRDYVYLRRHKEFEIKSKCLAHKEAIFSGADVEPCEEAAPREERPSVHSHARRVAQEMEKRERRLQATMEDKLNKVYVIVSRSCTHPDAPETKHAIRVQEYWSHMVVRTINGTDSEGMEFVLTYYDEPSVGGLPPGVSAWATGRAAPSYLARMHRAATHYAKWRRVHRAEEPDFEPFDSERLLPRPLQHRGQRAPPAARLHLQEHDMESSQRGPELDGGYEPRHKSTQTDGQPRRPSRDVGVDTDTEASNKTTVDIEAEVNDKVKSSEKVKADSGCRVIEKVKASDELKETESVKANEKVKADDEVKATENTKASETVTRDDHHVASKDVESKEAAESEKTNEEHIEESDGEQTQKSSWWRYLYPFYYFV